MLAGLFKNNVENKTMKSTIKRFKIRGVKSEFTKERIKSASSAANFIRRFYHEDIEVYESFFILLLNQTNDTIGFAKISQGGVSGTVVDIKIVAKYAVDSLASSIILAHNHPSGNLTPSEPDKQITKKIVEGLRLFDIKVFDHIILSPFDNEFISFAEENLLT